MQNKEVAIIILAAGKSSRMGNEIKQLLAWKQTTLLESTIIQAQNSLANDVYVVLGAYEESIKNIVNVHDSFCVYNKEWEKGMGSSIATAMKTIKQKKIEYDAILIMLSDQPLIDSEYLNKIIKCWKINKDRIIATDYKGRAGVPAIFTEKYFKELNKLDDDFGAKEILKQHRQMLICLDPEGKEIDIDNWHAYQAIVKKYTSI